MKSYYYDLYRLTGKTDMGTLFRTFVRYRSFRYILYYRILCERRNLARPFIRICSYFLHKKMSVEIPQTVKIGKGFLMIHPYCITFNSKAVVGDNFTIMKGATIGNIKTGKREGCPVIGNNVYVGLNSTVVGGVRIGNDVLIAANTYVNFDVPDGALVIGSPGVIHLREKASEPYINNSLTKMSTI